MITISINGVNYSLFESATATKQLDAASGSFRFDAVKTKTALTFPVKKGDSCEIYADDQKVITGFVEKVSGSASANNHQITIEGRDKTADFIDSTIDVITLNPPISLKKAIEKVIQQIGADILVIDKVNPSDFKNSEDLPSSEVGDNAFDFVSKLAQKKQVLLTCNGDGNLVIDRSTGVMVGAQIRHQIDSDRNNITSSSWDFNDENRFSRYKAVSQMNMLAGEYAGEISAKDLTDQQSNTIIDSAIRRSRQFIFQTENLSGEQSANERTKWEANIRKTKGEIYSCTLDRFYIDGVFLTPNLLMRVIDDFADINDLMLLNSVQYDYKKGSECLLNFVNKNSYKVALSEPEDEEVGNVFANA